MKKWYVTGVVLLAFMLVLSACGGSNNNANSKGNNDGGKTAGSTDNNGQASNGGAKEDVEFWYALAGANGEIVQGLVDRYNESQDKYNLKATFVPNAQKNEQLAVAIASGETPDLYTAGPPDVASLAHSERLTSIDQLAANQSEVIDRDQFFDTLHGIVVKNDELYGVPISVGVTALYYNEDLFEEHGLSGAPNTWEEMIEYAQAIADPSKDQWGLLLPTQETNYTARMWSTFLQQAGGDLLNEDATEATFHLEPGVKALQLWVDLFHKYEVAPLRQLDENTTTQMFAAGNAGMFFGYPLWTNQVQDFAFTTKTARPVGDERRASAVGGWYLTVPNQGKNPQGAYDFLSWLIQPENAVEWNIGMGNLPTQQASVDTPAYQQYLEENPLVKPFNDALANDAISTPDTGKFNQILDPIAKAVVHAIYQTKSVEEALQEAAEQVNAILAED